MCPACMTTAVLIAGGLASIGGLAAAAMKKPGAKNAAGDRSTPTRSKQEHPAGAGCDPR